MTPMHMRRFKTDVRLWLYLTLTLFVALWFYPWMLVAWRAFRPALMWVSLFIGLFSSDVPLSEVGGALLPICWFSFWFGIPASRLVGCCIASLLLFVRT